MLRKIRLTFAMICFVLITLLFLDFTGTLHGWFGWLAKIQFLPAVLALNVGVILCKHTIFRHDNFIGCFSADKIKMSARKYFCFNIPVYKNMAEESSCRRPYHEEYIQTSASGNLEGLYRSTYSFLSARR